MTDHQITLSVFLNYCFSKKFSFFITLILLNSLFLSLVLFFYNFKDDSNLARASLYFENKELSEKISDNYILNDIVLNKAINSLDLDKSKRGVSSNLLSLTNGQVNINNLLNYLSSQNYSALAKSIGTKPNELAENINKIRDYNNQYRTLTIQTNKTSLSDDEVNNLINKIIFFVNENIENDLDISSINLRKLNHEKYEVINSQSVSEIDNYIDLCELYIIKLKENFSSFSKKSI